MAVKLRLARGGQKKKPFYRIVAADARFSRDGRYLEKLGTYNPMNKEIVLNKESAQKWLDEGAIPTDTMTNLLIKEGFALTPAHEVRVAKAKNSKTEARAAAKAEAATAKEA